MKLPEKFERRMRAMLENEYPAFADALDDTPIYTGIRVNPKKDGAREAVLGAFGPLEGVPWCEYGYYADKAQISGNHPYHLAGLFYFQEPSAMSAVSALPIEEDDYILDLCAAPGGKTTGAGALLGKNGLLVANEIVRRRADILSENIERFGLTNAVVINETPQRLSQKFPRFFDKIIVDAPCSGEGMFRKEPQAVTEWSEEHVLSCANRQKLILDSAVKMLRPNGYLVYSTCTFAPAENEEICEYLLENYDLELVRPEGLDMLSSGVNEWTSHGSDVQNTRRVFPHRQRGEGHFAALFHSTESGGARARTLSTNIPCAPYREFEKEFLNIHLDGNFQTFGENVYLTPNINLDGIKVVRAGLHLGVCRKNRFEPSHALCLALKKEDFKNTLDLSADGAELKAYLMGNTLECDKKGWCAVCADGFPIGWGKASQGVLKNHFPKQFRLKK